MDSKSSGPAIITASSKHFDVIAEIYNEYIRQGGATMDEEIKSGGDIATWVDKFNDRERLFALVEGESVLGWGILKRYSDREGYRYACETAIYLTESEKGKGYGTMIKKHLIETCKELDYKHLVAKIFATNTASIQYNINLGYTIVGTQNRIGFRNDTWQDIVIMQLLIA